MHHTALAAAFSIGAIAVFHLPQHGGLTVWLSAAAALAATAFYLQKQTGSLKTHGFQAACYLFLAAVGAAYAVARTEYALSQQVSADVVPQTVMLEVAVDGLPERDEWGRVRFTGQARLPDGRSFNLLFQDYQGRDWPVGSHWRFKARLRPTVGTHNGVGFNREAWALANGIDGLASAGSERFRLPERRFAPFNRIRAAVAARWQREAAVYPQGAGLMKALAVGDRSGLDSAAWAAFRPLGLNHLISISGLHVSMVGLMAAWLAKRLMRRLPRVPKRPRAWALAVGWTAAAVYTGLAGFEIPALRSLLMLTVFALAWQRRTAWGAWGVWWTALAAVLLFQPTAVLAAGFWLSFGLVGGLLWVLAFRLPEPQQNWRVRLRQAVMGQWSATLLGGVATVFLFGLLPLFSPLVNAVAIPFFSWLLVPLALLASALPFDGLRTAAAWLAEQTMQVLLFLGGTLPESAFAHAPLPLFMLAVVAALLVLLPNGLRLKPLAVCALAAFALYRPAPFSGSLKITVYDVGQGLAVSLQTASQHILFDTGTPAAEAALLPALRAQGLGRIDHLILSHHDSDHDGAYAAVSHALSVGTFWAGQPEFYGGARHCADGISWTTDGVHFEFLTPPAQAGSDNETSCVLRVVADGRAVLLMGDLGRRGEAQLLEKYGGSLYSQVLILGHHGSKTASSSGFIHTVAPEWGIASSGFANAFGHPHPEIQTRLRAHGVKLLRTDRQGMLQLHFDDTGITVAPPLPKYWWQKKPFAD